MATFTHALVRRHAACMVDRTEYEQVPVGWHALVDLLFHDMAEALADIPEVKLRISQVKEKFGALRVHVQASQDVAGDTALVAVRDLIAAAEMKSARTCQVCGSPGQQRRHGGRVATLCDRHDRHPVVDEDDSTIAAGAWRPEGDEVVATRDPEAEHRHSARAEADPDPDPGIPARTGTFRLYALRSVADALGQPADRDDDASLPAHAQTDHEGRLAAILRQGDAGTWRDLARPTPACLARLDALDAGAPHMAEVTALVRRHIQAALAIGLPIKLPAVMLLGEPGIGKTWYLTGLGTALGIPTRAYPMSGATLGEGLQGSHPSWRNASTGLVARTLLQERVANPLILIDEIDKPGSNSWNADPYRAFYTLLEPSGAGAFRDEYLGFDIDASAISWVLAGNDLDPLPEPIRDRLIVIEIPPVSRAHLAAVTTSIYAEANVAMQGFFDPALGPEVLDILLALTPRGIRKALRDAMVSAAAKGRQHIAPEDVVLLACPARRPIGFHAGRK